MNCDLTLIPTFVAGIAIHPFYYYSKRLLNSLLTLTLSHTHTRTWAHPYTSKTDAASQAVVVFARIFFFVYIFVDWLVGCSVGWLADSWCLPLLVFVLSIPKLFFFFYVIFLLPLVWHLIFDFNWILTAGNLNVSLHQRVHQTKPSQNKTK